MEKDEKTPKILMAALGHHSALFERTILKGKTMFLGPPKVVKKYAQKVHSDWFICPQEQLNNREATKSSGRVGCFFGQFLVAQGIGGVLHGQ